MEAPNDLLYTKTHEWVKFIDGTKALIGITDFAQHAMKDIVFADLPQADDVVSAGDGFAEVESVKTVSTVFCPVSGKVSAVNEEAMDAPQKINADPYGTWLVEVSEITEKSELMDSKAYLKLCEEEE